jgi:RNA polymerase sigma-70 factor, ECF subfamily
MASIERRWGSAHAVGPRESESGPSAEVELLRAGLAGDRAALERLLALNKRVLYALCHGILGHPEDAEDAVQETFLRALRALPGFRGEASFRTWLCRIALHLCLRWKASRRHTHAFGAGTRPWDEGHAPATPTDASPEAIALCHLRMIEALRSLQPRHRAILLLKEREGWSIAEIAAALDWKEKRVENELSGARRALVEWRRRDAEEGDAG